MDRTRITSCSAIDRISSLPCDVMNHILKLLPLRDAVSTSILSRTWRYKWMTIPYLVFDENLEEKLLKKYNIESIVYQVLVLHKGPVVKFEFLNIDLDTCRPALDHWLHFLFNHHIKYLALQFPCSGIYETMPCHLFSLYKLVELSLGDCKLRLPSEFQGFAKLVNLDLSNVLIEPGDLRRFISKCPMLEHLGLYDMNFVGLEIDAPNLKSFYFCYLVRFPSICIVNSLLLENVSIWVSGSTSLKASQRSESNLIKFFGQLSSIIRLELDCFSLKLLARGGVVRKFRSKFSHLMVLQLFEIDFGEIDGVGCAVGLIRSSPNLRSLEIIDSYTTDDGDVKPAVEFLKEPENCKFTLSHIEYIEINTFSGSEPQMEFVKLILSAATALVTLVLKLDPCLKNAAKEESQMLKKLARFGRASSEAEIIIT